MSPSLFEESTEEQKPQKAPQKRPFFGAVVVGGRIAASVHGENSWELAQKLAAAANRHRGQKDAFIISGEMTPLV